MTKRAHIENYRELYHLINREGWESGEWDWEPDLIQWIDPITKYFCSVRRNDLGILCGYVALPPTHLAFNNEEEISIVEVHGGITFSGVINHEPGSRTKFVYDPFSEDAPKTIFLVGFDCGHFDDYKPCGINISQVKGQYCNEVYVFEQTTNLALQLSLLDEKIKIKKEIGL